MPNDLIKIFAIVRIIFLNLHISLPELVYFTYIKVC